MQTAVIFDVDGTLADVTSIRHHVLQRRKDFDAFHSLSVNVPPHADVVSLAHDVQAAGHAVVVVTARSTQWRSDEELRELIENAEEEASAVIGRVVHTSSEEA